MYSTFRRSRDIALLVFATALTALPSAAQISTSSGSVPVSGGAGSVQYIKTTIKSTCVSNAREHIDSTYFDFTYSSFAYVDSQGAITPFSGEVHFDGVGSPGPSKVPVSTCPTPKSGGGAIVYGGSFGSAFAVQVAPGSGDNITATFLSGTSGYINPKYIVVGVVYAPPGSLSSVSYTNSTLTGSTTSVMASLTNSSTITSSLQAGGLFAFLDGTEKTTQSSTVSQQNQGTIAITATYTKSKELSVDGPGPGSPSFAGDYEGLDHNLDLIEVWINPVLLFTEFTINGKKQFIWYGYGYSELDSAAPVQVVEAQVGCLNGHFAGDSGCQSVLQLLERTWAANENWPSGEGPGLTQTDLANVLKADPFAQCPFTSAIGSTSCPVPATGFVLLPPQYTVTSNSFQYTQCTPTEQPAPLGFTYSVTNSTTQTQQSTTTVAQTYGIENSFKGTGFLSDFQSTVGASQTVTYAYQQNSQITSSSTSTAAAKIQQPGPACVGNPCGTTYPSSSQTYGTAIFFDIYQDNYFGTFLFVPTQY